MSYIDTGRFEFPIKTVSTVKSVYIQTALMHDKWSGSSHLVCRIWVSKSFLLNKQQLSRKYTQVHTSTHTHTGVSTGPCQYRTNGFLFVFLFNHRFTVTFGVRAVACPKSQQQFHGRNETVLVSQHASPLSHSTGADVGPGSRLSDFHRRRHTVLTDSWEGVCVAVRMPQWHPAVCYFLGRVALPRVR